MIIIFLSSLSPLSTYLHYLCTVHAQSLIPRLGRDLLVVGKSGVFEQRVQLSRVLGHCEKLRQHWTLSRRNFKAEEAWKQRKREKRAQTWKKTMYQDFSICLQFSRWLVFMAIG